MEVAGSSNMCLNLVLLGAVGRLRQLLAAVVVEDQAAVEAKEHNFNKRQVLQDQKANR